MRVQILSVVALLHMNYFFDEPEFFIPFMFKPQSLDKVHLIFWLVDKADRAFIQTEEMLQDYTISCLKGHLSRWSRGGMHLSYVFVFAK